MVWTPCNGTRSIFSGSLCTGINPIRGPVILESDSLLNSVIFGQKYREEINNGARALIEFNLSRVDKYQLFEQCQLSLVMELDLGGTSDLSMVVPKIESTRNTSQQSTY
ncbi:uncharacterized protein LOC143148365 [Ptiloglossa arizonensis]|uniref:uncharacterized protein LOC143148365 n=1 Tax=Ptiloglossa arizonensis TaxID=3350558 RepID=UPI003F9F8262